MVEAPFVGFSVQHCLKVRRPGGSIAEVFCNGSPHVKLLGSLISGLVKTDVEGGDQVLQA